MSRLVRLLGETAIRTSGGGTSTTTTTTATAAVSAPPPQPVTIESDFVVILAALLCALICVVGLIAVARCAWLRRGPRGSSPSRALANKGLKKKVLQGLPKFTYISSSNHNDNDNSGQNSKKWMETSDCAICLAEFVEGDEIRVLPQCGHGFHLGCIDTWLMSHSSCPSCRQILVVARCQKCGQYPAVGSTSSRGVNDGGGGGNSRDVGGEGVVVVTVDDKNGEGGNASGIGLRGHHPHDNDTGNNVHNSVTNHNESGNNQTYLP